MAEQVTVLVVDDERGPRESLRMILSPAHRVVQTDSGAEALEILATTPVDLVTLDLNMPGMKGQDMMRTIRREFPHVEIVVITGCGANRSLRLGGMSWHRQKCALHLLFTRFQAASDDLVVLDVSDANALRP